MYTCKEYEKLRREYGSCSSWAIWDKNDQKDTSVIDKNINQLNTRYVFVGLNISRDLKKPSWSNFHGGRHDRKLMYACDETKLKGSYITDIFKDLPIARTSGVEKYLKEHPNFLGKNVNSFRTEMDDIKINKDTVFVVLGADSSLVLKYFKKNFQPKSKYENNSVLNYYHYSYYKLTDEEWVNGLGKILGIKKIEEWRKGKLK